MGIKEYDYRRRVNLLIFHTLSHRCSFIQSLKHLEGLHSNAINIESSGHLWPKADGWSCRI